MGPESTDASNTSSNSQKPQTLISYSLLSLCCPVFSSSVMSDSLSPWTIARQTPLSMGSLQARILEWVAMPSFRESSQPRDQTQVFCIAGRFFLTSATWEALLILYTAKNNANIIKTPKIILKSKFLEHLLCCLSLPDAQFSCALYPGL